jgi:hypothetical protein
MWREEIVPKFKEMLVNLNKGNPFTYEMVRVAVTKGRMPSRDLTSVWLKYRNGRIVCPTALKGKMVTLKDKYLMQL